MIPVLYAVWPGECIRTAAILGLAPPWLDGRP